MSPIGISRRYFLFGTLLTGALPRPTVASLKGLGYQSPNEKLNVAGIGAGGQPFGDLRACEPENVVALADVDWKRGEQGFKRWGRPRGTLMWDNARGEIANNREANKLVRPLYRKGWEIKL
jgi:hypothetical protein